MEKSAWARSDWPRYGRKDHSRNLSRWRQILVEGTFRKTNIFVISFPFLVKILNFVGVLLVSSSRIFTKHWLSPCFTVWDKLLNGIVESAKHNWSEKMLCFLHCQQLEKKIRNKKIRINWKSNNKQWTITSVNPINIFEVIKN